MVKLNSQEKTAQEQAFPWPPPYLEHWCAEVDAEDAPEWMLADLIPFDAAVLMSGAAKRAWKTWFAFQIVLALATGKARSGLVPTRQVNCLVLELEGPRKQTRNRWKALLAGASCPEGAITFVHRYPVIIHDREWIARLAGVIHDRNIGFVMIDTLAKAMKGDENSSEDVGEVMRAFDCLRHANTGCSVMYLHHLRKPPVKREDFIDIDDEVRGSTALQGFYDVHFAIRKQAANQDWLDLTVRHSDAEEAMYRLQWTPDKEAGTVALDMQKFDPENLSATMLDNCMGNLLKDQEYTWKALAEAWKLMPEMADPVREALIEDGRLIKVGRKFKVVEET